MTRITGRCSTSSSSSARSSPSSWSTGAPSSPLSWASSGATSLELFKNRHDLGSVGAGGIALGFVISFVVALVVIRWFIGIVSRRGFGPFAWYRIVAGGAALVWLLAR